MTDLNFCKGFNNYVEAGFMPKIRGNTTLLKTLIHTIILLICFSTLANAAPSSSFPLLIKGKSLTISSSSDRASIAALLKGVMGEEPSVSIPERIQYDFIAVEGQGPVCLLFDFDKKGKWVSIAIDANMKEQNIVGQQLVSWLTSKAGRGRKAGKTTIWKHAGLVYRLEEVKDAGDESIYSVRITRK